MNVLLDTFTFLWLTREPQMISALAREVLDDPTTILNMNHRPCHAVGRHGYFAGHAIGFARGFAFMVNALGQILFSPMGFDTD